VKPPYFSQPLPYRRRWGFWKEYQRSRPRYYDVHEIQLQFTITVKNFIKNIVERERAQGLVTIIYPKF